MFDRGSFKASYITNDQMDQYIKDLEARRSSIGETIKDIAREKYPQFKEKEKQMSFEELMAQLTILENSSPTGTLFASKIKTELQSYDILQNQQYSRLGELKLILEN